MKMYHLLPDQTVQPLPKGDHVLNFSDAEDAIEDAELQVRLSVMNDGRTDARKRLSISLLLKTP